MRFLPVNGFPLLEGIAIQVDWNGPARIARVWHGRQRWALWGKAGIRRHLREKGLFQQPFWNPYFNVRVLGFFVGAGFCISWPPREL